MILSNYLCTLKIEAIAWVLSHQFIICKLIGQNPLILFLIARNNVSTVNGFETEQEVVSEFLLIIGGGLWLFGEVLLERIDYDTPLLSREIEIINKVEEFVRESSRACILVTPKVFRILYLRGKIMPEQLENMIEDHSSMTLNIPGVVLGGRTVIVQTMPKFLMKARHTSQ